MFLSTHFILSEGFSERGCTVLLFFFLFYYSDWNPKCRASKEGGKSRPHMSTAYARKWKTTGFKKVIKFPCDPNIPFLPQAEGGGKLPHWQRIPFLTVVTDLCSGFPTWFHPLVDLCSQPSYLANLIRDNHFTREQDFTQQVYHTLQPGDRGFTLAVVTAFLVVVSPRNWTIPSSGPGTPQNELWQDDDGYESDHEAVKSTSNSSQIMATRRTLGHISKRHRSRSVGVLFFQIALTQLSFFYPIHHFRVAEE